MIAAEHEYFRTILPNNKTGVRMKARSYYSIKNYILELLQKDNELSFSYFMNKVHERFVPDWGDNTGWLMYHVKLDMEARGLIHHERSSKDLAKQAVMAKIDLSSKGVEIKVNPNVKNKFISLFNSVPLIIHSPGRINLIGEHTDYNGGYVMPAAIDKGIQIAIAPAITEQSFIYSLKYNEFFSVDLSNLEKVKSPEWANFFLGIVCQIQTRGLHVKSFNCVFDGDLPSGAGLSSSAALECGFVFGLNELFDLHLSKLEMMQIAQWSEHHYVGVKCGIMDQFTSLMGKENHVIVLDCLSLTGEYFPLKLGDYCLLLCDTNVKHSLASSQYNVRRKECEEGTRVLKMKFPAINSLRDVTKDMLMESSGMLEGKIYDRCLYVIEENIRVLKGSEDLQNGRLHDFGQKMFSTHTGLSLLYEVSCKELDFLVDVAKTYPGVIGARMMGGGFGGCTLNIIEEGLVGQFLYETSRAYKQKFGIDMNSYMVRTGNGTAIVEDPRIEKCTVL